LFDIAVHSNFLIKIQFSKFGIFLSPPLGFDVSSAERGFGVSYS